MLAHSGIEILAGLWLLVLWVVAEFYAVALGLMGAHRAFRPGPSRWRALRLGIFPCLFGGASLVWFRTDYRYNDTWWLSALAAVPLILGLVAFLGSLRRGKGES